jgi:oxygen-independent coproporphyrinogen-3 oxidase
VVSLGVGHVSVYPLSIEEGTPLGRAYVDPAWNDEDVQAERMERAAAVLESEGYSRYEVASYAKPGRQCRHNQAYWTGVPYLGVGRGAASMLDGNLYDTVREVYGWLPMRPRDCARARFSTLDREVEFLSEREAWAEDLMLGMRLTRGVKVAEVPPATVSELLGRGLVKLEEDRMAPTHDGWLLGNELYGILWDLAG